MADENRRVYRSDFVSPEKPGSYKGESLNQSDSHNSRKSVFWPVKKLFSGFLGGKKGKKGEEVPTAYERNNLAVGASTGFSRETGGYRFNRAEELRKAIEVGPANYSAEKDTLSEAKPAAPIAAFPDKTEQPQAPKEIQQESPATAEKPHPAFSFRDHYNRVVTAHRDAQTEVFGEEMPTVEKSEPKALESTDYEALGRRVEAYQRELMEWADRFEAQSGKSVSDSFWADYKNIENELLKKHGLTKELVDDYDLAGKKLPDPGPGSLIP